MNRTVVNNDDAIRRLLDEAGVEQTAPLAASLLALKAAGSEAPVAGPSPELLAFMAPGTGEVPGTGDLPESDRTNVVPFRRRRGVRGAALGLAVVAATGLGVSGVAAANPDFRSAAGSAVEQVVRFFDPSTGSQQAVPAGDTRGGPADGSAHGSSDGAGSQNGDGAGSGEAGGAASGSGGSGSSSSGQSGAPEGSAADGTGKGTTGTGDAADPARVPEHAGGGALPEPGSVPSRTGETAQRLLEDARGTQPSGVVPSLPAEDGLPMDPAVPGDAGRTVPDLSADDPRQDPSLPKD
ncbi:adhesin-like protein [Arthrobacter crystallopoietes BAB-32]|uniref:Adhesin-like protein n=1 Tax=Arthrobacter crystallopoietes BAB-32 TaxID=1246476 RepID=N1UUV2_9MICC|nr:hypothetical protein [Arthrobacter crystallopoietes]EMY32800.1 adhesin-like protein [Arthrobacter crystallopoietes BAB-32]